MSSTALAQIPAELRALPACVYSGAALRSGKLDKAPKHPHTLMGVSTNAPELWATFEQAEQVVLENPEISGVGVLCRPGIVAIDIDGAFKDDGTLKAGAREILNAVNGWAEISMSGNGLHVFAKGAWPLDVGHLKTEGADGEAFGLEIYGGNAGRYIALTGRHFEGTPGYIPELKAEARDVLQKYAGSRVASERRNSTKEDVPDAVQPDMSLDEICERIGKGTAAARFLLTGEHSGDRSAALSCAARGLRWANLTAAQMLWVLLHNDYAKGVALDHRGQNEASAELYLWQHHVMSAAKGPRAANADDFEDCTLGTAFPATTVQQAAPTLKLRSAAAFLAEATRLEWIIPGVLPMAELAAVFGPSGAGKSFFTTHMAACVAEGMPFYGRQCLHMPVVLGTFEGVGGLRMRLNAYQKHHGRVFDNLHVLTGPLMLNQPRGERGVIEPLRALSPRGLLLIDTLAQVSPGANENSGEDMGKVLARLKTVQRETGWMVLLVAHSGKDSAKGLRGWSGIKAALDAEIEVTKTSGYRAASVTKLKDGKGEGDEYRFTIADVEVGGDTAGVMVEGPSMRSSGMFDAATQLEKPKPRGANQQIVLSAFQGLAGTPGGVTRGALIAKAAQDMPTGSRARDRAREALKGLIGGGVFVDVDGVLKEAPP